MGCIVQLGAIGNAFRTPGPTTRSPIEYHMRQQPCGEAIPLASTHLSMHLARQIFSESSSFAPGRATHFVKHLSVTF